MSLDRMRDARARARGAQRCSRVLPIQDARLEARVGDFDKVFVWHDARREALGFLVAFADLARDGVGDLLLLASPCCEGVGSGMCTHIGMHPCTHIGMHPCTPPRMDPALARGAGRMRMAPEDRIPGAGDESGSTSAGFASVSKLAWGCACGDRG